MLSDVGWWEVFWTSNLFFLIIIKENWICAMTRHHTESNIILLKRNHPTDSGVREAIL